MFMKKKLFKSIDTACELSSTVAFQLYLNRHWKLLFCPVWNFEFSIQNSQQLNATQWLWPQPDQVRSPSSLICLVAQLDRCTCFSLVRCDFSFCMSLFLPSINVFSPPSTILCPARFTLNHPRQPMPVVAPFYSFPFNFTHHLLSFL